MRDHLEEKVQLVIERLKNLQRPENENDIGSSMPDGGTSIGLFKRDFGMNPWEWPQGVGLFGMLKVQQITGDAALLKYILDWYRRHLKEGLPLRNVNTSAPLLTMAFLQPELGQEARALCADWAQWILNGLPKTRDGGFQHTTTSAIEEELVRLNEGQIWIDTLFMTVLFLAKYGAEADDRECVDEAIHQFLVHIKYLYEKNTGLFYHGFTFMENNNFGGVFWCRGNCWYTVAVMELLEILDGRIDSGTKQFLLDTYRSQVEALEKLQAPSGLWNTVLTDSASYEEVSGSAGFVYGILKGIRLGYLDRKYLPAANKAVDAIVANIREDGTVMNVSAGTCMGDHADHYKKIIIAPMAYGQSLVVLALSEALRAV